MVLPELQTKRLLLRNVQIDDTKALYELRSDPEQMRFIPRPLARSVEDAQTLIEAMIKGAAEGTLLNWVVTAKEQPELFLGVMGFYRIYPEHFRAEIGYMIHPTVQGKGYTTEAIQAIMDYGWHTMFLHTIEAVIDPDNHASRRVLEKCGFVKEAHFRENIFFEGRFMDSVHYTAFRP